MRRSSVILLAVAVVAVLWLSPAFAEMQLAGVSIGQSPRTLMDLAAYGSPNGIVTEPLTFNPMAPVGMPVAGHAALPPYAKAVAPTALEAGQQEWIYNRGQISLGFIMEGRGPDAHVTDIIVAIWDQEGARAPQIRTERGISLGDSFGQVLLRYDYPPLVQTLRIAPAPARRDLRLPPGGRPAPGRTALPPVTVRTGIGEATATVGLSAETFTKHCVLSYPGVTFTLYNMKVVRIHIYEPPAASAP